MLKRRLTSLDTSRTQENIAYSTTVKGSEERRKQLEREHTRLMPFRQENDQQTDDKFDKLGSRAESAFIWLWQNKHYAGLIGRTREQFLNECSKIYGQTTCIAMQISQIDSKAKVDAVYQYGQYV